MNHVLTNKLSFYFLLVIVMFYVPASGTLNAQTTIDTTFSAQMNYIFANVDKSRVPYGILRDYSMEFTELDQFNGTAALADSNNCDINSFWDVYNTLRTGKVNSTPTFFLRQGNLDTLWYNARQA